MHPAVDVAVTLPVSGGMRASRPTGRRVRFLRRLLWLWPAVRADAIRPYRKPGRPYRRGGYQPPAYAAVIAAGGCAPRPAAIKIPLGGLEGRSGGSFCL